MRIALFGWGDLACAALAFLREAGEDVRVVITHRDATPGFQSLRALAEHHGIPTYFDEDLSPDELDARIADAAPELLLSFYYRRLLPERTLALAPRGGLNLHGSLLPRLRGRAPLNWALVEGEARTGVTLHHMVRAADAGDIVAQRGWDIGPRDTAKALYDRAVVETTQLLREVWPAILAGTAPRLPQDPARATYRGRRRPEDGRIDWAQPTRRIDGLVRAVTAPYPGAFTFLDGHKLLIWAGEPAEGRGAPGEVIGAGLVATGDGAYRITRAERAGDRAPIALPRGARLGDPGARE